MLQQKKELPAQKSYHQIRELLKGFSRKVSKGMDKVRIRLVSEMIEGILRSGSTRISRIIIHIHDDCKLIHSREKRISYEMNQKKWQTKEMRENLSQILQGMHAVEEETVIAVDLSDINKEGGKIFENMTDVHDGSSGKIEKGYYTLIIEAVKKKGEHFPLYIEMFSTIAEGFKSINEEVKKGVEQVVNNFVQKAWWVMDRGFDSFWNMKFFSEMGLRFIIRGFKERWVIGKDGIEIKVKELVGIMLLPGREPFYHYYVLTKNNRRNKWIRKETKIKYGYEEVKIADKDNIGNFIEVTVIVLEGVGKADERSYFYTNAKINSLTECLRIAKLYSRRWGCEEEIRFMKQSFDLEDVRMQSYISIQRLVFFVFCCLVFVSYTEKHLITKSKKIYYWLIEFVAPRTRKPQWDVYQFLEAMQKILELDFWDDIFNLKILGKL